MDREELTEAIRRGPVIIRMNDGTEYLAENLEKTLVTDISAYVLYRGDDGKHRAAILPLVTMAAVLPVGTEA